MKQKPILVLLLFLLFSGISISFGQTPNKKKSKKDYLITMHTPKGDIFLLLYDETPKHKENFIKLTEEGYFDSTRFHRVIKKFMIQGGDPNSKPGGDRTQIGRGGPGYTVDAEFVSKYTHKKGALAAARQSDMVNPKKASSGSQFYIVHDAKGCRHLNGSYTVFGEVIKGMDVVDAIAKVKVNRQKQNVPVEDIYITVEAKNMKKKKITKLHGYTYE